MKDTDTNNEKAGATAEGAQVSLGEFIRQNNISLSCVYTDTNALMDDKTMDHWKCVLRCGKRKMTLTFSKGSGHNGAEPATDEILNCLASDASGVVNAQSFEDWCSEYGYDTDSHKAEKIYKACIRQSAALLNLLGQTEYETLLWNIERL
jgi:hypothetical protein